MALKFACRAKTITREEASATKLQALVRGNSDRKLVKTLSEARMSLVQKQLRIEDLEHNETNETNETDETNKINA